VRAWLVRAEGGARFDEFEQQGFVGIRGGDGRAAVTDDLSVADEAEIKDAVAAAGLGGAYTRQLRAIVLAMQPADRVVVPGPRDSTTPVVLVGEIASDYVYRPDDDLRHGREVRWVGRIPRGALPADIWPGTVSAVTELDPNLIPDVG
jgi:predicted Mrr-cat superfamily restriction endonuclease